MELIVQRPAKCTYILKSKGMEENWRWNEQSNNLRKETWEEEGKKVIL
jgi:hypothetical protein